MRALGYNRHKRRGDLQRLNKVEVGFTDLVRLAGPLPVTVG
jgi:hypothetical protein